MKGAFYDVPESEWCLMQMEQTNLSEENPPLEIVELGRISYAKAYETQVAWRDHLIATRDGTAELPALRVFMLEHDPAVITLTKRKGIGDHLLASAEELEKLGIEVVETDRGGDITYHGPGQLVAYAVLDLKRLGIGVHEYMQALEEVVIETLAEFGIVGKRDPDAVGVWVATPDDDLGMVKICALGVRIRKWVTLHGLALNVEPDLTHFKAIVPCGLTGRGVTSMGEILAARGELTPDVSVVQEVLGRRFRAFVEARSSG